MRKNYFKMLLVALVGTVAVSCEKDIATEQLQESKLLVNIVPEYSAGTKASGAGHGVQAEDNTVNLLELFVFRAEGDDAGMLDAYKSYSGSELASLSNLELKTTTGKKHIYAVANSHRSDNWKGVKTLNDFKAQVASLQLEDAKNFTMVGNVDAQLQTTTSVSFSISRLVSRIQLASVKTDFAGTPWAGSTLQNVKFYIINVAGDKLYHDGSNQPTPTILNSKKLVEADCSASTMTGLMKDDIKVNISDDGYNTVHSFYCYENVIAAETDASRFTKLVIQGDLNGTTYYYPISINREGFGYESSVGHMGVKRNNAYTLNVTILRPGSLDPDQPVVHSALKTTLNVVNWSTVPTVNVVF